MNVIREEHVAELLRSTEQEPVLIVHRGAAEVVPRARLDDTEYQGAFQVVGKRDLEGSPLTQDMAALARRLDQTVDSMGG